VLDYFTTATQIGLTATPKETKEVSNIEYFGEPIYTYSLRQGISDGFLAPYKVNRDRSKPRTAGNTVAHRSPTYNKSNWKSDHPFRLPNSRNLPERHSSRPVSTEDRIEEFVDFRFCQS
jgi:type I site-specific restriction endonuclease